MWREGEQFVWFFSEVRNGDDTKKLEIKPMFKGTFLHTFKQKIIDILEIEEGPSVGFLPEFQRPRKGLEIFGHIINTTPPASNSVDLLTEINMASSRITQEERQGWI
ncbi:hypothetical protein RF11_12776 [Thelohanellus kitauei]|uniref:Uncharacterized protein n=1 Tax=Thelohanellus kitauei TaxID=669202 RepID=A0A0C2IWW7_THEKT|nr:hypothetical protein RF11_12776 [Thelohanellus kitauei]